MTWRCWEIVDAVTITGGGLCFIAATFILTGLLDGLHQYFLGGLCQVLHLFQVFNAIPAIDGRNDKEFEKGDGVVERGGLGDGFEVGSATRKRKSLATFFDEEDGEGIVNML